MLASFNKQYLIKLLGMLSILHFILCAPLYGASSAVPVNGRPIRLVVGYPAGGGVDFFARAIAGKMSAVLGQQCIVDNRPGAATNIASEIVAKSIPDGHTLLINNIAFAVSPVMTEKLSFNPVSDFSGISQVAVLANALVVNPAVPIYSVTELIAQSKARAKSLQYGSAGNGSSTHLAAELFKNLANIELVHIPYRGAALAMTALLSGEVQLMFASLPTALPQVRVNKLRALGVTSQFRSRAAPDLPTVAESGLPGFEMNSWIGVMGPSQLMQATINRLNVAVNQAVASQEVKDLFSREGADAIGSGSREFNQYVIHEIAKWGKILKKAGIRPD